jgi:hypothetical protein
MFRLTIQPSLRVAAACAACGVMVTFTAEIRETLTLDVSPQFRPADEPFRLQQAVEFPDIPAQHASNSVPPANDLLGVSFRREDGSLSAFPWAAHWMRVR